VLDDFESAPIDERLRETLRFLETLTLRPEQLDGRGRLQRASPARLCGMRPTSRPRST
jgi:hypothetical protein